MKTMLILASLLITGGASAAPENFRACKSSLVFHRFINCLDDRDDCWVEREDLGTLSADLSVDGTDNASGSATFKGVDGKEVSADLTCALTDENGDVNDMQCIMSKPVNKRLGKLSLSFNSASAPYFVAVFHEFGNAPIGNFSTADDCQ